MATVPKNIIGVKYRGELLLTVYAVPLYRDNSKIETRGKYRFFRGKTTVTSFENMRQVGI